MARSPGRGGCGASSAPWITMPSSLDMLRDKTKTGKADRDRVT
jgi:hypothetical protein